MPASGLGRASVLAVVIAVMLVLPLVVKSSFALEILIRVLLFAFIGTAWNLMGGYAKQLSLGHAAFFGLGAYTSTLLQIDFGISPWIGMVAGGFVGMLASLPIGWLCFRLRGPYFTIATIATAQVLMLIFLKFRDFAWGAEGTTIPNLGHAPLMMQFEAQGAVLLHRARSARDRAGDHGLDRALAHRLLPRGHRRGRGRGRSHRRQCAARQAQDLHDLVVPHGAGRHVLYAIHLFHRSADGVQLQHLDRGRAGRRSSAASARCGVRSSAPCLLETTSALLQSWLGNSIGGVQLTVYSLILMAVILWRPTGIMGYLVEVYARAAVAQAGEGVTPWPTRSSSRI